MWTTFDSSASKRPISKASLKAYLKRSNYTVDRAIIGAAAKMDSKMIYLTKSCRKLEHLEFSGTMILGESFLSSLPFAKSLKVLRASSRCEITKTCVEAALKCVHETIVDASFLGTARDPVRQNIVWPKLEKLRVLRIWFRPPNSEQVIIAVSFCCISCNSPYEDSIFLRLCHVES